MARGTLIQINGVTAEIRAVASYRVFEDSEVRPGFVGVEVSSGGLSVNLNLSPEEARTLAAALTDRADATEKAPVEDLYCLKPQQAG
jgi:hypothetical protein